MDNLDDLAVDDKLKRRVQEYLQRVKDDQFTYAPTAVGDWELLGMNDLGGNRPTIGYARGRYIDVLAYVLSQSARPLIPNRWASIPVRVRRLSSTVVPRYTELDDLT